MENSNSNLIVKIVHLLQSERDGLIFIDGKWGTGKTFLLKMYFLVFMILMCFIIFHY